MNSGIDKEYYFGLPVDLTYPSIDTLAERVHDLGPGCLIYKGDLAKAFRQIPVDPGDIPLLGVFWEDRYYFNTYLPMGLISSTCICQHIMQSICYIMQNKWQHWLMSYIDDFVGCELLDLAQDAYKHLAQVFKDIGLIEAESKASPPQTRCEVLGIWFDTVNMMLSIDSEKMDRVLEELRQAQGADFLTLTQV